VVLISHYLRGGLGSEVLLEQVRLEGLACALVVRYCINVKFVTFIYILSVNMYYVLKNMLIIISPNIIMRRNVVLGIIL
jgi:hypothetical protein